MQIESPLNQKCTNLNLPVIAKFNQKTRDKNSNEGQNNVSAPSPSNCNEKILNI